MTYGFLKICTTKVQIFKNNDNLAKKPGVWAKQSRRAAGLVERRSPL